MGLYLEEFPDLRLTADLSHWCAMTERLMTPVPQVAIEAKM
ncbi:MAG: hypothetical protein WD136_02510 [Cyanobium sp.]